MEHAPYHEPMTDAAFRAMSVDEYLRTEEHSAVKREYVHGFVYPLHGQAETTDAHALITGNVFVALRQAARRRGCYAYASDMRVATADRMTYCYPDVLVTCEPRQDAQVKVAPSVLVEVLSKSTAHNDHNAKYHAYTSLPSLQEYMIVEQDERRVYVYHRTATGWEMREYGGADSIPFLSLEATLTLDDIYDDVRPMDA